MMDAETGVYVEIEILDCVLAYGQVIVIIKIGRNYILQ